MKDARSTHSRSMFRRQALWTALTLAMGLPYAHAQVDPDGSTRTHVQNAPDGVPVVDIAAPNAGGVSHNRYQRFDVASNGLILNNSGAITNTQLAGYINGNTNLASGQHASLILNEVTSSLPSHLAGMIEVAGPGAQVVVANPNGIECSGCGFINTPRGMLTTGRPVLAADGSLDALRVTDGKITVGGSGLDGSAIDRLDLVARAVAIDAGVWARHLNVVTGANQVDYGSLTPHTLSSDHAPAIALDVSALGGMYAGVIRLVGTEAGVGVNNGGQIAAQTGDLTLTSGGEVKLDGRTSAAGRLSIRTPAAVQNGGALAAGDSVSLSSGGDLVSSGTLYSGSTMTLAADGALRNLGTIQSQGGLMARAQGSVANADGGRLLAGGDITLAGRTIENAGQMEALLGVDLSASGPVHNAGSLQADGGNFAVRADSLVNEGKLYALAGGWEASLGGAFANAAQGDIYASGTLSLQAGSVVNLGTLEARHDTRLVSVGQVDNRGTLQVDDGSLSLAGSAFANTGAISAGSDLGIAAQTASNNGTLVSGQALTLQASDLSNAGQLQSGTDLTVDAASLVNAGVLHAKRDAYLTLSTLQNAGAASMLLADRDMHLAAGGQMVNEGTFQAANHLLLHGGVLSTGARSLVYAGQDMQATIEGDLQNAGTLYGGSSLDLATGGARNAGTVRSAGALSFSSLADMENSGTIEARDMLGLDAGGSLHNYGKLYAVDGTLSASAGDLLDLATIGDMYAGGALALRSGRLSNAGVVESVGNLTATIAGDLANAGTMQSDAGALTLHGAALTNTGALSASTNTTLTATNTLDNGGTVVSGATLDLSGAALQNLGQLQGSQTITIAAANLANSGRIQAGANLALSGNVLLDNTASGQMLAGGELVLDNGQSLANAGVIQAAGTLSVTGSGGLDNQVGGLMYAGGGLSLHRGGSLANAGTLYGAQDLNLIAAGLTNSGSLRSGAGMALSVAGDASNIGSAYALGSATWTVDGRLANEGVLAAAGDTAVQTGSLGSSGTLAAGLQANGSLGTTGNLQLSSGGLLASHGRALAGGDLRMQGSAVDLGASQTRAGGRAVVLAQGIVDNRGGDLAVNGTLDLTATSLLNGGSAAEAGRMRASAWSLAAIGVDNRYGLISQSGASDLDFHLAGDFLNAHGTLATNAHDLTLHAASIGNQAGVIQHAGNGSLALRSDSTLDNGAGVIAGNGSLDILSAGALGNAIGRMAAAGQVTLQADSLDNAGGQLVAAGAGINVAHALANVGGTLQASGAFALAAGSLDNRAGYIKATGTQALDIVTTGQLGNGPGGFIGSNGDVNLRGASVVNAGQVYAGQSLQVSADGTVGNDSGALQAQGSLRVHGGALSNRYGKLEAGSADIAATLDVQSGSMDNTQGRIANAGTGATTLTTAGLVNRAGTLGGQGNVTLTATSLDNTDGGHLVAGQDLGLHLASLSNANGVVYAARNLAWSRAGAQLRNGQGSFGAGASLALALGSVDNAAGDLAAAGDVTLDLAGLSGSGRIVAGEDLSLSLDGDLVNGAGNTLKANRDLDITLGRDFINQAGATLEAVRNLSVSAANIDNASRGLLNSASTTLTASGSLSNAGRIEGDRLTLSASRLDNTGTLIGGTIVANAGSLTNGADLGSATDNDPYQTALIAATDRIALYVRGTLFNRDATIFTAGDMVLAGNSSLGRSAALVNRSGDIEADGDLTVAATSITNERRVIQTRTVSVGTSLAPQRFSALLVPVDPPDGGGGGGTHEPSNTHTSVVDVQGKDDPELIDFCNSVYREHKYGCRGPDINSNEWMQAVGHVTTTQRLTQVQELAAASAQSRLLAGGDITLSGSVTNNASTVAAGHDLLINAHAWQDGSGAVRNIAWSPTGTVDTTVAKTADMKYKSGGGAFGSGSWHADDPRDYGTPSSRTDTIVLGPAGTNGWISFDPGPGLAATMSAGNRVDITAHSITNTAVGADGKPVHAAIGLGANGAGTAVGGTAAGTVGSVSGDSGAVTTAAPGDSPSAADTGGRLAVSKGRGSASVGTQPGAQSVPGASTGGATPPQVVPDGSFGVPHSGLYTIHSDPGSAYLVETDPRFTSYANFISSDYLLERLHVDAGSQHKRLGDGFYEQRQVLDQITQLTGRRYLTDDTDALTQYRSLMDAGVQAAGAFDLSVGVALTGAQMAALTQDIVWLVDRVVDGQHVLVPMVYLSANHARELAAQGATIAGKDVVLTADGDITNQGAIAASHNAQLTAANLLNTGTLSAGNGLSVSAAQDILNAGSLEAGGNVALVAGSDVVSGMAAGDRLGLVDLRDLSAPMPTVALTTALPGTISAGGSLAIAAGRDLALDTAPASAGQSLSLAAGRDLSLTAAALHAGADAQLLAGRDLSLNATSRTVGHAVDNGIVQDTTHTVSRVDAGGQLVLAAGRDITSQGAQLAAGGQLAIGAGRDLNLDAITDAHATATGEAQGHNDRYQTTYDETVRGSTLSGAAGVSLSAGRDAVLTAAAVSSDAGQVALAAGHDIQLNAAEETHATTLDTHSKHSGVLSSTRTTTHDASTDTLAIGTTLSGASVAVAAGHDLATQGAQLLAKSDVGISAGHDVLLGVAYDTHSEERDRSTVKRGGGLGVLTGTSKGDLMTRVHTTQHDASTDVTAVGSLVSGDRVTIAAGHDFTAQASQVAGTHDVVLAAGHDLTLDTVDNAHSEEHDLKVNTYGAQRSGLHGMFGVAKAKQTAAETDVTPTGSLVGSTDGSVTLSAGQDVRITGSDVLSQTGTAIVGQNVTIEAALGTVDGHQTQSLHTGGVMAGLTGGAASAAEQTWAPGQAAGRASDKRLKALYAAQAAYGAYDTYNSGSGGLVGAKADGAKGAAHGSGETALRIGIGASSASAHSDTHDDIAYGSHIQSAGNVTIAATNGDLNVIGSDISGQNVTLAASRDLNLLSQAEHHAQTDHSANARGELGISIGSTTGFYATVDGGKGVTHGNGTSYADSHVTASDTLSLVAGHDANIVGAQARGNTVLADIGHDLAIASQQTTDDYANQYWQAGGTYVYGYGSEVHAAAGKVDSSYKSVTEVSGIGAGSGGYQIHVGGNTDLAGAVIASIADPSKNLLDTGTLSYRDLENQASYSAVNGGISVSSGSGGVSASPSIGVPQLDDTSSITRGGIAQGTIITRDNPETNLSGLERTPNIDAAGLKPIFDQQKVAEQQELGNVAGQVGMRAAGDIASYEASHVGTEEEQKSWQDGGANKVLLHGIVGAATAALGGGDGLQGALGATASERASGAMQDYLVQHGILPNDPQFKALMQLGNLAIGSVAGGSSGAATALQGEQFNRQLHETEKARIKSLAGGDPQKEADLSAAACALVHCSAEYAKDSPEYAYYSQLEALGGQPQYADERTLLQQQGITRDVVIPSGMSLPVTENLFDYSFGDKTSDTLAYINNSYGHPFTRAGGALQAVGGGLSAATGYGLAIAGAGACVETAGGGCVAIAGGVLLGAWGADQAQAGARTAWNGSPTQTFGGQAIQDAFGISPGVAELLYGAVGGVGDVYAGLALLPAGSKAAAVINADGTLTLTGNSNSLNAVSDFEQLAKGSQATPTPGGYINQAKVCGSQCVLGITDANDQALAARIAQNGDPTGELTESLVSSVAQKQGMTVLEGGKYGGNKGFDAVLQNADGSVTILLDAKQMSNGAFSLGKTADGSLQLSPSWTTNVLNKLDPNSSAAVAIVNARKAGTLSTAVIGVDKNTGRLIGVPIKIPSMRP